MSHGPNTAPPSHLQSFSMDQENKSTTTTSKSSTVFKKKSGTNDLGKDYEHLYITNLVLKLVLDNTVENFYLSSNNEDFGAFDDVVVEIKYVGQQELVVYALQLKHCESKILRTHHLQAQDGDFSINKYFSQKKLENVEMILLTNSTETFHENIQLKLKNEEVTVKVLKTRQIELCRRKLCKQTELLATSEKGITYKFNSATHQDFFQHFSLYTNQANVNVIEKCALNLLENEFGGDEHIFNRFVNFITRWSMRKKKKKLDKVFVKEQLFLLLTSPFTKPLTFSTNTFVDDREQSFRDALALFDITRLKKENYANIKNLWKDVVNFTNPINAINQKNNEYFISLRRIKNEEELNGEDKEINLLLWLLEKCPLILEGCPQVYKALEICNQQNLIILDDCEKLMPKPTFRNLSDLRSNKEIYEKIINTFTFSIEGQAETSLKHLIEMDNNLEGEITVGQLATILNGPLLIGNQKEKLPPCHIPRKLTRILVDFQFLKNLNESTFVIVTHVKNQVWLTKETELNFTNDNSVYFSKNEISADDFSNICSQNPNKSIHQLKYLDKKRLEWIRSKIWTNNKKDENEQTFETINKFRLGDDHSSFLSESDMFNHHENNINIICANPGMGKSTIAKSLKNSCSSEVWTIIIYARNHGQHFRTSSANVTKFMEQILRHKSNEKREELDDKIINIFMERNRLRLIWDGLDEVSEDSFAIILSMVEAISKKGIKQWLTSRNNLKNNLERRLNTFSRDLKQFDEREQKHYIRDRLKATEAELSEVFTNIKKNIKIFSNQHILGIPLQIFMLTELLAQDKEKYLKLLAGFFTILELYQHFVDEQFKIFFEVKRGQNLNNDQTLKLFEDDKKNRMGCYQETAFNIYLGSLWTKIVTKVWGLNTKLNTFITNIATKGDEVGLIHFATNIDDVEFVHNSYGEFFAALYLFHNNPHLTQDSSFISNQKHNNIRFFLDLMLARNSKPFVAVLCQNYSLLEESSNEDLEDKDSIGRNMLELACSWNKKYHLLPQLYSSNFIYPFKFNSDDINVKALDYRAIQRKFEKIHPLIDTSTKQLLQFFPFLIPFYNEDRKDFDPENLVAILYYAVKLDNTFLFDISRKSKSLKSFYRNIDPEKLLGLAVNCKSRRVLEQMITEEQFRVVLLKNFVILVGNLNWEHEEMLIDLRSSEGKTLLHYACQHGILQAVLSLISIGSKVDVLDQHLQLPLHYACQIYDFETMTLLVDKFPEVNVADKYGLLPIHYACEKYYSKAINCLLRHNSEINIPDKNGWLPIHHACFEDDFETVELLLSKNLAVNVPTINGSLPLHLACKSKKRDGYKIVELLLNHGSETDVPDSKGLLPIHLACQAEGKQSYKVVELLFKHGTRTDVADFEGLLPEHYACKNEGPQSVEKVKLLLENGTKADVPDLLNNMPMHFACSNKSESAHEMVQLLLEHDTKIDVADSQGLLPIHLACQKEGKKSDETVKLLLKKTTGIDVADFEGCLPMHHACKNEGPQSLEMVKLLVENGAKTDVADLKNNLPVHFACKNKSESAYDMVTLFVESGTKTDVPDSHGLLPIHLTCQNEGWPGYKILTFLLENGSKLNVPDLQGNLPIHLACQNEGWRGYEILKLLVENGSEINFPNVYGVLPIHCACRNKGRRGDNIVSLLLKNGAKIHIPDGQGNLPIHYACMNEGKRSDDIVNLLLTNGAKVDVPDFKNNLPIHLARKNKGERGYEIEQTLLKNGAKADFG